MVSRFAKVARMTAVLLAIVGLFACQSQDKSSDVGDLTDFATRYAAAWSGQDPEAFAAFYAEDGDFRINNGEVSAGREEIADMARAFMAGFPDMLVRLVKVERHGELVNFHWHWTGTNTGPGGTGNAVDLKGFEQWALNSDGLIQHSYGNMDDEEYQRQLHAE